VAILAIILVALIALEHIYILVLEMFLWTSPRGMKAFGTRPEQAAQTRVMAANQGLYNGFLAAGLIWSLLHPDAGFAFQLKLFFLGCVLVAGLYGGATASRKIFLVQALPAAIALIVVVIAGW
jgi:putative membrane protein